MDPALDDASDDRRARQAATPWLSSEERRTWVALSALTVILPAEIETQLRRDSDLSSFEYAVLTALSERDDRTLPMTRLAMLSSGSLSRLSHVARSLETKGYLRRMPLPQDGRVTVAVLLDPGYAAVVRAAPEHVRHVRRTVFDALTGVEQRELGRLVMKVLGVLDPAALDPLQATAAIRDEPRRDP